MSRTMSVSNEVVENGETRASLLDQIESLDQHEAGRIKASENKLRSTLLASTRTPRLVTARTSVKNNASHKAASSMIHGHVSSASALPTRRADRDRRGQSGTRNASRNSRSK